MDVQYALIGLLAAVPIAVILVVFALRGYDITLLMHKHDGETRRWFRHPKPEEPQELAKPQDYSEDAIPNRSEEPP